MKVFTLILALWVAPVWSADCRDFVFRETPFTACTARLPEDDLRLFLLDENGKNFGQFQKLESFVKEQGLNIIFATNGAMF